MNFTKDLRQTEDQFRKIDKILKNTIELVISEIVLNNETKSTKNDTK